MKHTAVKHIISKEKKGNIIVTLENEISNNKCVILTSQEGVTVEEVIKLKKLLLQYDSKFKVVKNRLFSMALQKLNLSEMQKFISGSTGVIFCPKEEKILDTLKCIVDYSQKNTKIQISGGYLYQTIVEKDKICEIAKLPSKEVLISKILYLLFSMIKKLHYVTSYHLVSLINVINRIKEKQNTSNKVD